MKRTILTLLLLPLSSFSGSSNILISCISDSGRTTLIGNVPGDHAEFKVSFEIDTNKIIFEKKESTSRAEVYEALHEGIFTMKLVGYSSHEYLEMHAIPKSVLFSEEDYGNWSATFKAKIKSAPHPEKSGQLSPIIFVACNANYRI